MKKTSKKIVSLILTIAMLMSFMTFTASAENVLTPTEWYAGVGTVTLKFSETVSADNAPTVAITTFAGEPVEATPSYKNDIMTLTFTNNLILDTDYKININGETKVFTLKKVWEPTFNSDQTVSGFKVGSAGNGAMIAVTADEKILFLGDYCTITPDYADATSKKNLSLIFKAKYIGGNAHSFVGFNISRNDKGYIIDQSMGGTTSLFGWRTRSNKDNYSSRITKISDGTSALYTEGFSTVVNPDYYTTNENNYTLASVGNMYYGATDYPGIIKFESGIVASSGISGSKTDKISVPDDVKETYDSIPTYEYSVDKMGSVGTLSIDNNLIDVHDTAVQYAAYNTTNNTSLTAPTTGYMSLIPIAKAYGIMTWDMALVESVVRDYATGSMSVTGIDGDTAQIKLTFSNAVDGLTSANIAENVILTDLTGEAVEFTSSTSGSTLTIKPQNGFTSNKVYNVTVKTGLAYDGVTLSEQYSKKFKSTVFKPDFSNGLPEGFTQINTTKTVAVDKENQILYIEHGAYNGVLVSGIVDNIENYTLTYDTQHYGTYSNMLMFNVNGSGVCDSRSDTTAFGWRTRDDNGSYYNQRREFVRAGTDVEVNGSKGNASSNNPVDGKAFGTLNKTTGKVTYSNGVATLPAGETATKYSHKLEKAGKVGKYYVNGQLVDTYDTEKVYAQAPSTGKILFTIDQRSTTSSTGTLAISNIEISYFTTDIAEGTFDVTDIYANKNAMTVTFDETVSGADVSKVTVSQADGTTVECTKKITGNQLVVTPDDGFELNGIYNITIAADFGYDAVTISNEYSKNFRVNKLLSTNEDGFGAFTAKYNVESAESSAYMVEKNKVLYINDLDYNTVYLRDLVENYEEYSISFDAQYYKLAGLNLFFNASGDDTILNYGNNSLVAFGWKQEAEKITRDLRHENLDSSAASAFAQTADNAVAITAASEDVIFANSDVTVPSTEATVYKYTVDKFGTKATLYINDKLADTYETKDEFTRWNEYAPDKKTEQAVPVKGFMVIAPSCSWKTNGAKQGTLALSNVVITSFEIIEGCDITNVDAAYASGKITGTVNFANYSENPITSCKIIVGAYKGNNMVGLTAYTVTDITNEAIKNVPYEITGLNEKPDEVRAFVWKDFITIKPYCSAKIEGLN